MKIIYLTILCLLCIRCNKESIKTEKQKVQKEASNHLTLKSHLFLIDDSKKRAISTDKEFRALLERIKSNGLVFSGMKPKYSFDRDTLISIDSINYYLYDKNDLLNYFEEITFRFRPNAPYFGESDSFIKSLRSAELLYGVCYGGFGETESCMIEVFRFDNAQEAKIQQWKYDKTQMLLFPKTLSYAFAVGHRLYLFHARYMGASWYLKNDFEWFKAQF